MPYPPAPWTLKGCALQTAQLVDIAAVRPLVPPELEIISVWPGKTLGGVYLASYGAGSALEYSELIVLAGFVSYSGKWGGWISHIYVDSADSAAGGREIWGLPKELADFTWEKGERSRVTVRQGDRLLCRLTYTPPNFSLPLPVKGPFLSALNSDFLLFQGEFESRLGLIGSQLEIPAESPFAMLGLGQPWLAVCCDQLRFVAGAPEVVGQRKTAFSYH